MYTNRKSGKILFSKGSVYRETQISYRRLLLMLSLANLYYKLNQMHLPSLMEEPEAHSKQEDIQSGTPPRKQS